MCGIVGALSFEGARFEITEPFITRMRESVAHRGPDGSGTWISPEGRVGLGHRRLAIIDLSAAAAQPMASPDGALRIVFNGEIYNHAEIRAELAASDSRGWMTDHSDTEVLLRAFERWGIDCLPKLRGMFAFALWDARSRQLWLVRDRIGIKPLYYSVHHGRITFGSEIKALLTDPEQPRAVNERGLFDYLSFLAVPAPDTLFEGIRKLAGGSWLRVRADGSMEERRWWDAWDHAATLGDLPDEEIAARVLAELTEAVRLHGVSDRPVGIFLSGGIDSSANAALFSRESRERVRTFSIGYEGGDAVWPDELPFARRMAAFVNAEHHERILSADDLVAFLPEMIRLQDEPIADPVCVPIYYLSKLAREHGVPVCQVGEGADELFCGYPRWLDSLAAQAEVDAAGATAAWIRPLRLASARWRGRDATRRYELMSRAARGEPLFWGHFDEFTQVEKLALVAPPLRARFARSSSWEVLAPIRRRFEEKCSDPTPLQWMSTVDLNIRLPELLLMRVDKMSMGVGLEGRVPFLDHRVVELALGISERVKTRGGGLKPVLKKAVRGVIPDDLIERPKQGFGVPLNSWFAGRLEALSTPVLDRFCREAGFLDPEGLRALRERSKGRRIWPLWNLALWWQEFIG